MNIDKSYEEKMPEWIGEIPMSWRLSKVRRFFKERLDKVADIQYPPLSVTQLGIVDQLEDVAKSNAGDNRKLVLKNDFVINSRSDRKGSSGISPRDGSVSLINIVLEPQNINYKFILYLFKSYYFKEEFFRNGKGIHWDLWTTRWENFKNIQIPIPHEIEQRLIAKYLDKKIEKFDLLIEDMQKKIELLKEKKTALMNQYVTKGLNLNVPMKNSGIAWMGEIPKHWKLSKLKYELEIHNKKRIPLSAEERGCRQGSFPYYGSTNLIDWVDDYLFDGRHILIAEDGANLVFRNIRLSFIVEGKFWVNNHAHVLKSKNPRYEDFFCELLEQTDFRTFISGSAQPKLTLESIKEIPLCVPSENEVVKIISEIVLTNKKFSKILSALLKKLELLKEYRQSLISSVVTGKIRITEDMI
tara:strand:- start:8 stop:1246 length:1239 start_codon:yes stop_codon:yes gene_type:complete